MLYLIDAWVVRGRSTRQFVSGTGLRGRSLTRFGKPSLFGYGTWSSLGLMFNGIRSWLYSEREGKGQPLAVRGCIRRN